VLVAVALLLCAGGVDLGVLLVNNARQGQEPIESCPTADRRRPADRPARPPTDLPTDLPTGAARPAATADQEITVEYEVTGDGPVEIVYLEKLGGDRHGPQRLKLPWRKTATMRAPRCLGGRRPAQHRGHARAAARRSTARRSREDQPGTSSTRPAPRVSDARLGP
jgi:hypothetical protein